jgi:hypothetical protein
MSSAKQRRRQQAAASFSLFYSISLNFAVSLRHRFFFDLEQSGEVKIAFDHETTEKLDEKTHNQSNQSSNSKHLPGSRKQRIDKVILSNASDKVNRRALFTIDSTTVEVCIEDNKLTWTTVSTGGMLSLSNRLELFKY